MDKENFDKLVSSMSIEERQSLLDKLKVESTISTENLYIQDETIVPGLDAKASYAKLPWYSRLLYFIQSIFKSKSPEKLYADSQVSILGSKINEKYPGIYNYQRGLLLSAFLRQMEKLKEAARFFYLALDVSVNKDRSAFFAFLGSLEMADLHKSLNEETDPKMMVEKHPDTQEAELRPMALKAMDEALKKIPEEHRAIMYQHSRSLFCLKELSTFLYDRVIMAFEKNKALNEEACSANNIRELLTSLNNILVSLKTVPSMPLLKSLFVFMLQEKAEETGFDINKEIQTLLIKAESSLGVIREFNSQIPLTHILRCASRNMSIVPHEISGGEDWFVFYRDYWKKRLDTLFTEYIKNSRERQLRELFHGFFKGRELKSLENIQDDSNPDKMPINGVFALSFLFSFYSFIFMPEINGILRPVLIDGEFEKAENRIEFAEAYNNLIKLEEDILKIDKEISAEGDFGKRYIQVRQEMTALAIKRRKVQFVLEEAQEVIDNIIQRARSSSKTIVNVMNGLMEMQHSKNEQHASGLNETVDYFKSVIHVLDEIDHMESEQ